MKSRLRVAHCGSGRTGVIALRQIIHSPDLQLVGQLVESPEKVGLDSGAIAGEPPIGVLATDSRTDFVALEADCVTYMANGLGRDIGAVADDLCALLASGKNVVTTSLGELIFPPSLDASIRDRLSDACARGASALIGVGIAPGFSMDFLPLQLATLTESPTRITVAERILCGSYASPQFFSMLGFGRTAEQDAASYTPGFGAMLFGPPLELMASGLGWTLESIRECKDVGIADRDYSFDGGEVPAGTIASVRIRTDGIVADEPRLTISEIWTLTDDMVDDWEPLARPGSAPRRTLITIEGRPSVRTELALGGDELPGATATAARAVHAIRAVCAATPGVHSCLDLLVSPGWPR